MATSWRRWCAGGGWHGAQGSATRSAQQLLLTQDELGNHVSADVDGSARIITVVLKQERGYVSYSL